jgi:hypothetical protein
MRDLRDPNIMQIAGFDATVPALVSDFLREGPF